MPDHDYEAGLRDGKILAVEEMLRSHAARLDNHDQRLRLQEKITYGLLGAIALVQFAPIVKDFIS